MAIGHAVVYYARAAHPFSAGMKYVEYEKVTNDFILLGGFPRHPLALMLLVSNLANTK